MTRTVAVGIVLSAIALSIDTANAQPSDRQDSAQPPVERFIINRLSPDRVLFDEHRSGVTDVPLDIVDAHDPRLCRRRG